MLNNHEPTPSEPRLEGEARLAFDFVFRRVEAGTFLFLEKWYNKKEPVPEESAMIGIPKAFGVTGVSFLLLQVNEISTNDDMIQAMHQMEIDHVYELMLAIQNKEEINPQIIASFRTICSDNGFDLGEELSDNLIDVLNLMTTGQMRQAKQIVIDFLVRCRQELERHAGEPDELALDLEMMGVPEADDPEERLAMADTMLSQAGRVAAALFPSN